MPWYDLACDGCCIVYEDVLCSIKERDKQVCPECGSTLRTSITPVLTVGVMPSKPIKVGNETYTTNAEFRAARSEAEAAGFRLCEKSDNRFKNMQDRLSARREKTAKAQGFRNEAHRQATWKKQKLEGKKVGVL